MISFRDRYNRTMEKVVRKFSSFEEAERADREEYRRMTPQERIDILLALIAQGRPGGADERLERVYRVVELPRR